MWPPSITNCRSLLKLMSIESVMLSNHLTLCRPLPLLPSIFPSIRVFSNESVLHIRWPKYWSFSFSISPSNEYSGLISFRIDWFDLAVQGSFKSLLQHHSSKAWILQCSAFFMAFSFSFFLFFLFLNIFLFFFFNFFFYLIFKISFSCHNHLRLYCCSTKAAVDNTQKHLIMFQYNLIYKNSWWAGLPHLFRTCLFQCACFKSEWRPSGRRGLSVGERSRCIRELRSGQSAI